MGSLPAMPTFSAVENLVRHADITEASPLPFVGDAYREIHAALTRSVARHDALIVLTGDSGVGKTTLWRSVVEQTTGAAASAILNPFLNFHDLLKQVLVDFGLASGPTGEQDLRLTASEHDQIRSLQRFVENASGPAILVVDDAHLMNPLVLGQLRALINLSANARGLTILLVGQPPLEETLRRREFRIIGERVVQRSRLGSLSKAEVPAYVAHCYPISILRQTTCSTRLLRCRAVFRRRSTAWSPPRFRRHRPPAADRSMRRPSARPHSFYAPKPIRERAPFDWNRRGRGKHRACCGMARRMAVAVRNFHKPLIGRDNRGGLRDLEPPPPPMPNPTPPPEPFGGLPAVEPAPSPASPPTTLEAPAPTAPAAAQVAAAAPMASPPTSDARYTALRESACAASGRARGTRRGDGPPCVAEHVEQQGKLGATAQPELVSPLFDEIDARIAEARAMRLRLDAEEFRRQSGR